MSEWDDGIPRNHVAPHRLIPEGRDSYFLYALVATPWWLRHGGYALVATPWWLRPGGYALVATPWWLRPGGYASRAPTHYALRTKPIIQTRPYLVGANR